MYYVIRPVVKRLPVRVFAALAMLAAIAIGTLQAFRHANHLRRVLSTIGRKNSLLARIRFAVQAVYAKTRHLDWYIYEGTPHLQTTWDGPAETEPCIYVLAHFFGSENVAAWVDLHPAVMVRFEFAGEGQLDPSAASPGQMWRAHQAKLRELAAEHRQILVGDNPMACRKLLKGRQSIILYQDLWDPKRQAGSNLLGKPTTLMMGSVRIAKLAGSLPMRYMMVSPRGAHWRVHVGPRIPATYDAVAAAIENDIRDRPAEWMLWREWFDRDTNQGSGYYRDMLEQRRRA